MIGRQEGVGGPTRRRHRIAGGIDHEMLGRVAGANATHIPDVVGQRGEDGMAPIAGRDGPLEASAAQNVLDAKGNQGCVFAIVIEGIAAGDALYNEPGGFVQGGRNSRLLVAVNSAVGLGEVSTQCIS